MSFLKYLPQRSTERAILTALMLLFILAVNVMRFQGLDSAPPGVHPDESIDSATLQCIAENGLKDPLAPHPVFTLMGYSFKGPTYIYPGIAWVKIFGFSVESIRAYAASFIIMAIAGLFFLGRLLFGMQYALWLCLLASISPWIWPVSRFGNDSLVSLPFMAWGLFFFLRSNSWKDMAVAGLLLAGSVYGYSTYRMFIPMVLPLLFLFKYSRHGLKLWPSALCLGLFTVTLIPLVQLTLSGALTQYFNEISIFSKAFLNSIGKTDSFADIWDVYWRIYGLHLSPVYLFVHGQGSVMYLTQFCGLFSWIDIAGLAGAIVWAVRLGVKAGAYAKEKKFIPFAALSLAAFFIGLIPVGFTHYNVPSVMRISEAWPFAMMFFAFFLWRHSLKARWLGIGLVILACVFFTGYTRDYFANYPKANAMDFGARYKELAERSKTDLDWVKFVVACGNDGMRARYYLMRYRGMTCNEADKFYMAISGHFKSRTW